MQGAVLKIIFFASVFFLGLLFLFYTRFRSADTIVNYGATFSYIYATNLGLDWKEVYLASLDELGLQDIRLPVYWSEVEKDQGEYDFSDIDWMMEEAQKREVNITMAIGMKVPRWPECFIPEWLEDSSEEELNTALFLYIEKVVSRYKDHEALAIWQIENEPFFPFGECPKASKKRFKQEVNLIRNLDSNHPIQLTTSGEQSLWFWQDRSANIVGASLYRKTWNHITGFFTFPVRPNFYRWQNLAANFFFDQVIISELQMEPWFPENWENLSLAQQISLFSEKDFDAHIDYVERTGIDDVFLWGIEWWYYLKEQGRDDLWKKGIELLSEGLYGSEI